MKIRRWGGRVKTANRIKIQKLCMIKFLIASYVAPLKALKCHSFQNFPKTYEKKKKK